MVAPAPTDDIAAALPTFPGCVHAAFRKGRVRVVPGSADQGTTWSPG
jgi:hypothetical protein